MKNYELKVKPNITYITQHDHRRRVIKHIGVGEGG